MIAPRLREQSLQSTLRESEPPLEWIKLPPLAKCQVNPRLTRRRYRETLEVRRRAEHRRKEGLLEVEIDRRKRGFGKTVMVVDDNTTIRKLLANAFLSDGFKTCVEAADGKEAIELAQKIEPDMVTMDLSMPNMNGLQASSALRKLFPKVPIILFTLYANKNLEIEAANFGINLVLLKTVPLPTLIDKAHQLMAGAMS